MTPARAAAYLGGGILLAGWLASAAGVVRPSTTRFPRRSAEAVQLDAVASRVQSQAARLRHRLAVAPAPQAPLRNPFAFVEAPASSAATVPRPDPAPPVLEQIAAEPDLILLGVAEQGSTRTAMIASGDELLMTTEGQTVAGRYRVGKVSADAIELIDLGTGATRRLSLKSPVSLL
jgi:hypothetical protein